MTPDCEATLPEAPASDAGDHGLILAAHTEGCGIPILAIPKSWGQESSSVDALGFAHGRAGCPSVGTEQD